MMPEYNATTVDNLFSQLNEKANAVYKFVLLYTSYMSEQHNYGVGQPINMVEVHTLTAIEENPGITISQLANMWRRTNSALSQTATKLEQKGYIVIPKTPEMWNSMPQKPVRNSARPTKPTTPLTSPRPSMS